MEHGAEGFAIEFLEFRATPGWLLSLNGGSGICRLGKENERVLRGTTRGGRKADSLGSVPAVSHNGSLGSFDFNIEIWKV
jgi:hypothetical protein